jgi:hypothetical protein
LTIGQFWLEVKKHLKVYTLRPMAAAVPIWNGRDIPRLLIPEQLAISAKRLRTGLLPK